MQVKCRTRIVYAIHGGPMAGRKNYQRAYYQQVRPNLWLCSWVEETGTTVTITLDIEHKRSGSRCLHLLCAVETDVYWSRITTFMAFSKGHWMEPEQAHGYKKDQLEQWRGLSEIGNQARDRYILPEQATINEIYEGKGDLEDIDMSWPTVRRLLSCSSLTGLLTLTHLQL